MPDSLSGPGNRSVIDVRIFLDPGGAGINAAVKLRRSEPLTAVNSDLSIGLTNILTIGRSKAR
jgi:hypothetical protein